jgi:Putative MetA-pathway of phenol degradation
MRTTVARNHWVDVLVGMAIVPVAAAAQTQESSSSPSTPEVEASQKPSLDELVKLKQNPVSGLRQVVFQAGVSPDLPGSGKTAGAYSLQAVWPYSLSENWKVISYSILPVLQFPGPPGQSTNVGLGDTLINLFVSPKKPGSIVWGAGPAILLPTRTDPALGSNRVGLGPSAVVYYAKDAWGAGIVLQNVWSLGGTDGNNVNEFGAQYFLNYNLPNGWYLYSNATITANWNASTDDRWTVPLGGGIGRIFNIGKQPVNVSLQAFSNVVTPRDGPKWTTIFQFAFLFP